MDKLHLKILSMVSGYKYDDKISKRANKEAILSYYGLLRHNVTTIKKDFDISDKYLIERFLHEQCNTHRYCSVLVHTGKNESIGGCGVIYVMSEQDIASCIESLGNNNSVTIYSRQKSVELSLNHFDNYSQKKVRFGGGFRIQIDGVRIEQNIPILSLLVSMSFDDFGSRVLSENVADNSGFPIRHMIYEAPIINGQLAILSSLSKNNFNNIRSADNAITFIIEHLLSENVVEIDKFLKVLLSLRPISNIHQLEGMYGVSELGIPMIEIIDFDGIEVFDLGRRSYTIEKTLQEKLLDCQLEQIGFIERMDIDALSNYLRQESEISLCLKTLYGDNRISSQIIDIIVKAEGESLNSYFNRMKPYIYAFNILRWIIPLDESHGTVHEYRYTQNDKIYTYLLDISNIGMAFLLDHDELIYFSSENHAREIITRVFGSKILPVYLSYAREGD